VNLTRFHGVFAPKSLHRVTITPAKQGKGASKVGKVHLKAKEAKQAPPSTQLPPPRSL
jgi:hypothetical protein